MKGDLNLPIPVVLTSGVGQALSEDVIVTEHVLADEEVVLDEVAVENIPADEVKL